MKLTKNDIIIDVETRCELNISTVGTYKYVMHPSFKLLLLSFCLGDSDETYTYHLGLGETLPEEFIHALFDVSYRKHAHNVVFEYLAISRHLCRPLDVSQWYCSMAAVAFCGLPLGLEDAANTLQSDYRKMTTGSELIEFFSVPRKDKKFNDPLEHPDRFHDFARYNKWDVLTEKANLEALPELPEIFEAGDERDLWLLDFEINLNGIPINVELAKKADFLCSREDDDLIEELRNVPDLSCIKNPNSQKQVATFLKDRGYSVSTMQAQDYEKYLEQVRGDEIATLLLNAKRTLSLSSASKFGKFVDTEINGRIYFALQYYGAVRTGRWGGRGAQPQNLKRNEMPFEQLCLLRELAMRGDYGSIKMYFCSVKEPITELGRTVVEPIKDHVFTPTDFSAIEARMTAWIAKEEWRLEVFRTHGKIYEASAAMMFKVPIESIKKGSNERMKGKYAELALGFGGWKDAFYRFGAQKYMTDTEMLATAKSWREASPNIVKMWRNVEECAVSAVRDFGVPYTTSFGVVFQGIYVGNRTWLTCKLLSGRRLMYYEPKLVISKKDTLTFSYRRLASEQYTWYGMIVENIVQAMSRDLLREKMLYLKRTYGLVPVMHVHDEIVPMVHKSLAEDSKRILDEVMAMPVSWAQGLPLKGDTSILNFYMKE